MRGLMKSYMASWAPEFEKRVLPLGSQARGLLTSEAFAFCILAHMHEVDLVLESGIWQGQSTEAWCKFFKGNGRVVAIDRSIPQSVSTRLESIGCDLTLRSGDGVSLLPQYVDGNKDKTIAVFIDGPKGRQAIDLGLRLLERPNVKMVGIHDVHKISRGKTNSTREYFDSVGYHKFCTDEDWFVKAYCHMDLGDTGWDSEQSIRWIPYELVTPRNNGERRLGSYGPTIGFLLKEDIQ